MQSAINKEAKEYDKWHTWARKTLPLGDILCEICHEKPATQHASRDHNYSNQSIEDVMCICHGCHKNYDHEHGLSSVSKPNRYDVVDMRDGEVVAIVGVATKYFPYRRSRVNRTVPNEWDGYDIKVSLENDHSDSIIELARPMNHYVKGRQTIVYLKNEWSSKEVYCERLNKSNKTPCGWGGAR